MAERGFNDMLTEVMKELIANADPKAVSAALMIVSGGVAVAAAKIGPGLGILVSSMKRVGSSKAADATVDQP